MCGMCGIMHEHGEPRGPGIKSDCRLSSARLFRGGVQGMYAIIETGGKQYRVQEGDTLFIEKLNETEGGKINFEKILAFSKEGEVSFGKPYIEGVSVDATVLEQGKGPKVIVYKYKAKKDYRRKQGHRQPYTKVKIDAINA